MVATNINFLQLVKLFAVVVVENDVCEREIHPRVAVAQSSIDGLTIF